MLRPHIVPVAASILALLVGCAEPQSGLHVGGQKERLHPVFGNPIALPGADSVMFPFAAETPDSQKQFGAGSFFGGSFIVSGSSDFQGGSSAYYYAGGTGLTWNNVAFYDPATGQSRLLLDKPALISRFHATSEKGLKLNNHLLFGISMRDTNRDGMINQADAVQLFRTDADGGHLTPVTEPNTQIMDVQTIGGWLYLRVRRDSDSDSRFTENDAIDVLRVNTNSWGKVERVLSDDLSRQAFEAATTRPAP